MPTHRFVHIEGIGKVSKNKSNVKVIVPFDGPCVISYSTPLRLCLYQTHPIDPGLGAWSNLFRAIGPEKEYPKLVRKFGGLFQNKFAGRQIYSQISWFSDFFAHFSTTERDITNLKTHYETTDTPLQDGEKMV